MGEPMWFTDQGNYHRTGAFPTGVTRIDPEPLMPRSLTLEPAYPNPFNPSTHIRFGLPNSGLVELSVFDIRGREVSRLLDGVQTAGWMELEWQPRNHSGELLPSGVYTIRLTQGSIQQFQKVLYLR